MVMSRSKTDGSNHGYKLQTKVQTMGIQSITRAQICNKVKKEEAEKLASQMCWEQPVCVSVPLAVISAVFGSRTWFGICIFTFSMFLLLCVQLLYYPSKQYLSESGRNMTSSPSHQSTSPGNQRRSQDALCQLLLYTDAQDVWEMLKHFSKLNISQTVEMSRLQPALEENVELWCWRWRKDMLPLTVHYSGWWCTCHLYFLYNEQRRRWQESRPWVCFAVL